MIKFIKKYIFLTIIFAAIICTVYYLSTHTNKYDLRLIFSKNHEYKNEFAVLNKSFKRDVKRSANLYESFEKYYIGAENIPFYIVIPETDLDLFKSEFNSLKLENKIKGLPIFITEHKISHLTVAA